MDIIVKYVCIEFGVIYFIVYVIWILGCVYGKGVRVKIVFFIYIMYNY